MAWLGIDDSQYEGPFLQSDNLAKHTEAAQRLYAAGPGLLLRLHPRGRDRPHR